MSGLRTGRVGRAVEWLLLFVCSVVLGAHTLPKAWRTLNTDFPNYYLTAQLARQGYDTSQAYDWRWIQREKDHRAIDQRIVGLAPITPFSTLFVWPLTGLAPLQAKHLWLLLQLALLIPIALMLQELTGQPLRRIALLTVACFPLHRNLLYGQFYILLLAMLVAACWAYRRQLSVLSGVLIGLAAMTKIFPAVFLLYFLRKRDGRALLAAGGTMASCFAVSIAVFGWGMHRYYLQSVLPWTLRGEILPPYLLASSSLSTLLHRLLVYEPQWNPHPWHNAPMLAAVLAPMLQMVLIAPAILLIRPGNKLNEHKWVAIEWSALLCATLAISTIPASYNFTLLLFPMVVLCSELIARWPAAAVLAVFLYLGIGSPAWNTANVDGLRVLLHEPRFFLLLAFTALCCWTLAHGLHPPRLLHAENVWWCVALLLFAGLGVAKAVSHQRNLYADYAFRLPMRSDALFVADPADTGHGIEGIGLFLDGYHLTDAAFVPEGPASMSSVDQLTFASTAGGNWVEEVAASSRILPPSSTSLVAIEDGGSPKLSPDGHLLGYIRDQRGRGQLLSHAEVPLTPVRWNVLDAAPLADGSFFVAASEGQEMPGLFHVGAGSAPLPLRLGAARYPALSADGRWLAYSRYQSGRWNLWLLDMTDNATRPLTQGDCNQVEPAWEADSKTLLYASDCGRALGFTAICRRRVIP
jgi:hypothetical protein